jgi:hypothetical protein
MATDPSRADALVVAIRERLRAGGAIDLELLVVLGFEDELVRALAVSRASPPCKHPARCGCAGGHGEWIAGLGSARGRRGCRGSPPARRP